MLGRISRGLLPGDFILHPRSEGCGLRALGLLLGISGLVGLHASYGLSFLLELLGFGCFIRALKGRKGN